MPLASHPRPFFLSRDFFYSFSRHWQGVNLCAFRLFLHVIATIWHFLVFFLLFLLVLSFSLSRPWHMWMHAISKRIREKRTTERIGKREKGRMVRGFVFLIIDCFMGRPATTWTHVSVSFLASLSCPDCLCLPLLPFPTQQCAYHARSSFCPHFVPSRRVRAFLCLLVGSKQKSVFSSWSEQRRKTRVLLRDVKYVVATPSITGDNLSTVEKRG